jgi:hypothetical protein
MCFSSPFYVSFPRLAAAETSGYHHNQVGAERLMR